MVVVEMRGGMFPMAYVYPQGMRSTRDLMRRRLYMARQKAELQTHIQNTNIQYNPPSFEKRIAHRSNRTDIGAHFSDPAVRTSVEVDAALMDALHEQILIIERQITALVPEHDPVAVHLLRSIPGIGKILALVILYEIHDISRFPKIGNFISYARLVKCPHESAGKRTQGKGAKIGNVHLKWAFLARQPVFSCAATNEPNDITRDWSAATAKPRRCQSSPRSSGVPSTSCSRGGRLMMPGGSLRQ